jgi:hypothetical protein
LTYTFLADRLSFHGLKATAATAELADLKLGRELALSTLNAVSAVSGPGLVQWLKSEGAQGDLLLAFFILSITSIAHGLRKQGIDLFAALAAGRNLGGE